METKQPESTILAFGRYQRLEFVGEGGMARVYKAFDPSLNRHIAVKILRFDDPELAQRLLLEVRAQVRSSGFALYTRWRAQEEGKLMQEFGQQVKEMEAIMRFASLLPLHDVKPEMRIVRTRLEHMKQQMSQIGPASYGPGHYAVGRGYMALHEYEMAKSHLEQSWNKYSYHEPQVAYALGLTLAVLYQQELEEVERISGKVLREARKKELEKEYRDPASQHKGPSGM